MENREEIEINRPQVSNKKSKKGWLFGLIEVLAIDAIGAVVALVLILNRSNNSTTDLLTYSNAFFIFDGSKYTLWDADGRRVTNDEYTNASSFVGGYASVEKDGQHGIIRDNGGMSVDFGKYENIEAMSGLYLARSGGDEGESFLITGDNKELARGAELNVYMPSYDSGFAVLKEESKIKVFNYAGKLIFDTDTKEGVDDLQLDSLTDFGILYYGNQNFVFDAREGKLLASFEGNRYVFEDVPNARKMLLLREDTEENKKYALVVDDKAYMLDNQMKYYAFIGSGALLLGYDSAYDVAILNDTDYSVLKKTNPYLEIKNSNNYAIQFEDGGVEIYQNNEKVKEFDKSAMISTNGYLFEDYYGIDFGGKAMFYNLDGSVGIDHEYREIRTLFDKFHHAVVTDDGEEYYLIDGKGNRITDYKAKYISIRDGGYEVKNMDDKCAIANKDGQLATDFIYEDSYYNTFSAPHNVWTARKDGSSYDIVDVDNKKVIVSDVEPIEFYNNYFTARNSEGKTLYYAYNGTLVYTSENSTSENIPENTPENTPES